MSRPAVIALLLALAVVAVYAPVVDFEFVDYDDDVYVTKNQEVRKGLTAEGFRWAFTTGRASNWHPVTWLSHMLDVELYGLDPGGHHATNLLLHVLNTLLLFALLAYATGRPWPGLVAAALFALHPINVESVAWVAERKNLLSTTLGLASALAYVAYTKRGGASRYLLTAGLLALGLMAKPMLVTLPFLFLLLDYWPLDRLRTTSPGRLLLEKLPLVLLAAASGVVTLAVQHASGAVRTAETLALGPRLANGVLSYVRYLRKLVWPDDLALLYQHPYLPGGTPPAVWQVLGALLLLAALTVTAVFLARRRWILAGWLWFLLALLPVLGLIQAGSQAMADRYAYLPLIGLFVVLSWSGAALLGRLDRRRTAARALALAALLAVLAGLAVCTRQQQRYWRNSLALFERGIEISPRNPTLQFNLGTVLETQGRTASAIEHYRQALQAEPGGARIHFGLANALAAEGRSAEAIREYAIALQIEPDDARTHFNLANTLRSRGKTAEAIEHYRQALELAPGYAEAHNNLGTALLERGALAEALEQFERGVEADPAVADLQNNLGVALVRSARWAEAPPRFRTAAALAPEWPAPLISAAWILAAAPPPAVRDPAEALSLARRAVDLGAAGEPAALDALALALASNRRFDEAAQTAERAADLADREGRDKLAEQIRGRLALYRRGVPFVMGP